MIHIENEINVLDNYRYCEVKKDFTDNLTILFKDPLGELKKIVR